MTARLARNAITQSLCIGRCGKPAGTSLTRHHLSQGARLPRRPSSTWSQLAAKAVAMPHDGHSSSGKAPKCARPQIAQDLVDFVNHSWTQFHAVEEGSKRLAAAGFERLSERAAWSLKPGGRYYFTRNASTLVAFAVGADYKPGNGFHLIGAHTDSPCLKLKPVSKLSKAKHWLSVNVEPYGGGLWHTWFDRDLSVAGRVLVRTASGGLQHRLVRVERPIMRIPMLAIHLNRDIYTEGFKPNKQTHLPPILATAIKVGVEKPGKQEGAAAGANGGKDDAAKAPESPAADEEKHHAVLLQLLAHELGSKPEDIVDFELNLCDVQPGTIGGIQDEFIFAGRLDNLAMSFCSLAALLDTCGSAEALAGEGAVRGVALFDNEEVGSASAAGAGGPVMMDTISRVTGALAAGQEGALQRALQASFLVSADMAHALHPNYADKHDSALAPAFHKGLVLKHNVNQRYATNAVSAALFREVARRRKIPTQEFAVRSDMACGSTIGPILASSLGCRTIDVGAPQLAMHSIREMCGTDDIAHSYNHFVGFFEDFTEVSAMLEDIDSLPPADIQGEIEDPSCQHVAGS